MDGFELKKRSTTFDPNDPEHVNKRRKKAFQRFVREIRPLLRTAEEIIALNRVVKSWIGEVRKRRLP